MSIDRALGVRLVLLVGLVFASVAAVVALGASGATPPASPSPSADVGVLVGAGDIAECEKDDDEATAALIEDIPGIVFTTGDAAYTDGTTQEFAECFGPSWGRFRDRMRPAPGNHEYHTAGAGPYFDYFGDAAGRRGEGWYSYDVAGWHVVVLNSNCDDVGGCDDDSAQLAWLRDDLAASEAACTVAMWHHPRFSSGRYGDDPRSAAFWQALHGAGADLVLNGHEHEYERLAPQTPDAVADPVRGIRQIIVGTGGGSLREFATVTANSEVRLNERYGVLRLDLAPGGYRWQFLTVPDAAVADAGAATCH